MAENNNRGTMTSTQIRNFYSDGMCYLNTSFFNTNLSFKFYPFLSKDNLGRSVYDRKNYQNTTVNFEGAYALFKACEDIENGNIVECDLPIPCANDATLNFKRQITPNGPETILSITKNGVTINFKFSTMPIQVKENGQSVTKVIEVGLGAFKKTIDGYLTGINADRHLNKLTDDYVKSLPNNGQQQSNNSGNNNYRNNYNNNSGGKRYNNNYGKSYNNNGYNNQGGWNQGQNQQNMSTYQLPN